MGKHTWVSKILKSQLSLILKGQGEAMLLGTQSASPMSWRVLNTGAVTNKEIQPGAPAAQKGGKERNEYFDLSPSTLRQLDSMFLWLEQAGSQRARDPNQANFSGMQNKMERDKESINLQRQMENN